MSGAGKFEWKQISAAFHGGLKQRMTDWAIAEGIGVEEIGELELGFNESAGHLVMIVNLKDGRQRGFPFELKRVN